MILPRDLLELQISCICFYILHASCTHSHGAAGKNFWWIHFCHWLEKTEERCECSHRIAHWESEERWECSHGVAHWESQQATRSKMVHSTSTLNQSLDYFILRNQSGWTNTETLKGNSNKKEEKKIHLKTTEVFPFNPSRFLFQSSTLLDLAVLFTWCAAIMMQNSTRPQETF